MAHAGTQEPGDTTDVYLLPYHSEPGQDLDGASGQFEKVERSILAEEFPYDNGDDPSFYIERRCGRLTWGVCRPNVRTQLKIGDIVVFFSFTNLPLHRKEVLYRMSAVATVEAKLDHRAAFTEPRLKLSKYINTLVSLDRGRWTYDESDRPTKARHPNWFWRMADQQRLSEERFKQQYAAVYDAHSFTDRNVASNTVPLASNYILFSQDLDETCVAPVPPDVAVAVRGKREQWFHKRLPDLTVKVAKEHGKRDYLRTTGKGHVHPPIRFTMLADEAKDWRARLIAVLRKTAVAGSHWPISQRMRGGARRSGCGC
jgi:hypothetical protein